METCFRYADRYRRKWIVGMEYKDRTWCPKEYNKDCDKRQDCWRVMTERDEYIVEHGEWRVCQFADKPTCHSDNKEATDGVG